MNGGNEVYVGDVVLQTAGTRSGIKRFESKKNQKVINGNAYLAKTNMFNTPGESFVVDNQIHPIVIAGLTVGITVVGMGVGFYMRR